MQGPPIIIILFDFGGVLAEEGFRNGLLSMAKEQGLNTDTIMSEGMLAVYDSGFVIGKGSAADFWSLMRTRTGLKGNDDILTKRILDGFVVRPGMIRLIKALRERGYETGILSDQTHWLDELDNTYHFSEAFSHIYNSYYLGKGKRDSTLFLDVAADLKTAPGNILFVDDDMGNIKRAEESGLRTIQFVDEISFRATLNKLLSADIDDSLLEDQYRANDTSK